MRLLTACIAPVVLALLTACSDGRWAPGYLVTADGEVLSSSDINVRTVTQATIVSELGKQLGAHWRVEAAIAELPVYHAEGTDGGRSLSSGWWWPKATATITLIGDGQLAEPPLSESEITGAVRDYLSDKVEKARTNLVVTTVRVSDAARFAARPAPAPAAGTAPVVQATTGPRSYTALAGDTWADLSQAFYGSTQHWRLISEANPGELTPGRVVTIPPKP